MNDFQLIVIGAGPGGYVAALRATKLGLQVAVVERRETGGTCLNRGCIPTKTLLHSSQVYQAIANGEHAGITAQSVQVDMAAIFAHKRQVSQQDVYKRQPLRRAQRSSPAPPTRPSSVPSGASSASTTGSPT